MANQGPVFKVIVAEDHDGVRAGIVGALSKDGDMEVVGQASTGDSLCVVLEETPCDLLVLDLSMPRTGGLEVLGEVGRIRPGVRVLVYTLHNDAQHFLECISRGVSGYVIKDEEIGVLLYAARRVLDGKTYFSPPLREFLGENHSLVEKRTLLQLLSEREHQVLAGLRRGASHEKIAAELGTSSEALERLVGGMMLKLGAHNDAGLAHFAREMDEKARANSLPGLGAGHAAGPSARAAVRHSA